MDIARKRNTVYFPIIAVQRFSSICVFAYAHNREGERKKPNEMGYFISIQANDPRLFATNKWFRKYV